MRRLIPLLLSLMFLPSPMLRAAKDPETRAMATLTSRSCKPGSAVELVVTVREAVSPAITEIDRPAELRIRPLKKARRLATEEGMVWLFRYRVKAMKAGDYEIAPIRVTEGGRVFVTNPLFLHVSGKAEVMPYSEREFSHAVALPGALCREVLAAAPLPTPKLEPTPEPDRRPAGAKVLSTVKKGLVSFWNFPGKSSGTP